MVLRPYRKEDRDPVIALIDGVYREYADRVHLEKSEADLRNVPANYAPGYFMVLEDAGEIRATIAISPDPERPEVCFLKRLYLDARLRGTGAGARLMEWFLETARGLGMTRAELWSDVRFERAHAFYRKHGFQNDGEIRDMDDSWQPYKDFFSGRTCNRGIVGAGPRACPHAVARRVGRPQGAAPTVDSQFRSIGVHHLSSVVDIALVRHARHAVGAHEDLFEHVQVGRTLLGDFEIDEAVGVHAVQVELEEQ